MVKKFLKLLGIVLLFLIISVDAMFIIELKEAGGNPIKAATRGYKKCCGNGNSI